MEIRNEIYTDGLSVSIKRRGQCLTVSPVAIQTARAFTAWTHHHLAPPSEVEIVLGARTGNGTLVGVVFVVDGDVDGTAELACLSTDGTPNASSALLGAARKAAHAAGYRHLIVYTWPNELGTSLDAAGFRPIGQTCTSHGAIRVVWEASTVGGRR
ncbi:XF1762 family protein [Nonomuraea sp. NPDC050404]|uniref:XF1762 family protein n=1 Tax=Nonomuraea sp. NPDC050404 TaxID=3155783 RepID=UPI0033D96BC3